MRNYLLPDPQPTKELSGMLTSFRPMYDNSDGKSRCYNCKCCRDLSKDSHVWLIKAWWYAADNWFAKQPRNSSVETYNRSVEEYHKINNSSTMFAPHKESPTIMICEQCFYEQSYARRTKIGPGFAVRINVKTGEVEMPK